MKVRFTGDYRSERGAWSEGDEVELDAELAAWLERDVPGIIEDPEAIDDEPVTEAHLRKLSRAELDELASDRYGIDGEVHPNIDSLIAAMLDAEASRQDADPKRQQAGRQNRQQTGKQNRSA